MSSRPEEWRRPIAGRGPGRQRVPRRVVGQAPKCRGHRVPAPTRARSSSGLRWLGRICRM